MKIRERMIAYKFMCCSKSDLSLLYLVGLKGEDGLHGCEIARKAQSEDGKRGHTLGVQTNACIWKQ